MASSLYSLVKNLSKEKMFQTSRFFQDINLVSRKRVHPYEWMDSFEKFKETLPPTEKFYFSLNDEGISDEDFQHACNIWERFGMQNMGNYHDLYLKTDVLLLADVFEEFRKVCIENYELDPAWYYTVPGLAWNAALKKSGVKLDLLTGPDMLLFFEGGMRGGVSASMHRYGRSNNKYMKDFDGKKTIKYLLYLDANNPYG